MTPASPASVAAFSAVQKQPVFPNRADMLKGANFFFRWLVRASVVACATPSFAALPGINFEISGPGCRFPDVAFSTVSRQFLGSLASGLCRVQWSRRSKLKLSAEGGVAISSGTSPSMTLAG